ncbi:MAG: gamma-glutamyltransferase family protein [Paracoccaceae bacterium]
MDFLTRPDITGTFGVATSTHWIASAVGMRILEIGGNAFDAGAAMGFVLHVVEPHLNGPLGDMPALIKPAGDAVPTMVCGQGTAPARATIDHYKDQGLDLIPGTGLLATVIPGAFDAWMLMLRDHGTLPLRSILEPAIYYARSGHPLLPRVANTIANLVPFFQDEWPTSYDTWLPGGVAPEAGRLFCNPVLADTWERLLSEVEHKSDRADQIQHARDVFYRGFVAEHIDTWMNSACVMDATGERRKGVLSGDDMANWSATFERPLSTEYHGWTVWKGGAWTQGPSLLQSLNILSGCSMNNTSDADFVHTVTETIKLAFADREAYYGDPDHTDLPMELLLSAEYADARRNLIGANASLEQRPGHVPGFEYCAQSAIERAARPIQTSNAMGAGEPTMAHLTEKRGDTVHLDVIDRWGNMISATPSGGWLQSSPTVPGLGMPLNTRAQMFWLDSGLPTSLAPGRRPRTTLSPSMAYNPDQTLAFGTPGGDQQDQWQLIYLLRLIHSGMGLQAALEAPLFHTSHFQSSFYPRAARPAHLMVEPALGADVISNLRARGHDVEISDAWSIGRLTAAARRTDGLLNAAATPRLMQAYAVGR